VKVVSDYSVFASDYPTLAERSRLLRKLIKEQLLQCKQNFSNKSKKTFKVLETLPTAHREGFPTISTTMTQEPNTIVLADDHTLIREGIRSILENELHNSVIAQAGKGFSTP
jgi:PleD family two-component response regulator